MSPALYYKGRVFPRTHFKHISFHCCELPHVYWSEIFRVQWSQNIGQKPADMVYPIVADIATYYLTTLLVVLWWERHKKRKYAIMVHLSNCVKIYVYRNDNVLYNLRRGIKIGIEFMDFIPVLWWVKLWKYNLNVFWSYLVTPIARTR